MNCFKIRNRKRVEVDAGKINDLQDLFIKTVSGVLQNVNKPLDNFFIVESIRASCLRLDSMDDSKKFHGGGFILMVIDRFPADKIINRII